MGRGRGGTECQIFVLYARIRICIFVFVYFFIVFVFVLKGQPTASLQLWCGGRVIFVFAKTEVGELIYHWTWIKYPLYLLWGWFPLVKVPWYIQIQTCLASTNYLLSFYAEVVNIVNFYRSSLKEDPLWFKSTPCDPPLISWRPNEVIGMTKKKVGGAASYFSIHPICYELPAICGHNSFKIKFFFKTSFQQIC